MKMWRARFRNGETVDFHLSASSTPRFVPPRSDHWDKVQDAHGNMIWINFKEVTYVEAIDG